ncbi:MAG: hypothetical protein OEX82_00765 [Nitrosomonas sp.]|nr:hypothetical protein [Nitrosomonas sp.]
MLNSQNVARLTITKIVFFIISVAFVIGVENAFSQSTQSIAPNPAQQPEPGMTGRAIDRTGTAFSGRNSVSIKSTDAGRVPRYQQSSGCINCGTVDFINVIGQGGIDLITGGVISGVIRNKVFQHGQGQHPHYPTNPQLNGNIHPGHPSNQEQTHYKIGVTMDDGTQSVITHQHAPNFHRGDRIELIDGEIVPHTH